LKEVVGNLSSFTRLLFWIGKANQRIPNCPPCKCGRLKEDIFHLCSRSVPYMTLALGYFMPLPIGGVDHLLPYKRLKRVRFSRKRPSDSDVVAEADEKYTFALLGDAKIGSVK
jgi:hypothetical protein